MYRSSNSEQIFQLLKAGSTPIQIRQAIPTASRSLVSYYRRLLGIPAFTPTPRPKTKTPTPWSDLPPDVRRAKIQQHLKWKRNNKERVRLKEKDWRNKNREKLRMQQRALMAKKPGYHRNLRRLNLKRCSAYARKYQSKPEVKARMAAYGLAYRQAHPEKTLARTRKRQALKLKCAVNLEGVEDYMVRIRSKRRVRCYYCDHRFSGKVIHFDHVIPLSKGGAHSISNLATSCPACNLSKHAKRPSEWDRAGQLVML